ncbi:hypothetical protein QVA66_03495 [Staphylococcus chromogenes]|nr:hypothetical protein [Staphylococcus chromogenes]
MMKQRNGEQIDPAKFLNGYVLSLLVMLVILGILLNISLGQSLHTALFGFQAISEYVAIGVYVGVLLRLRRKGVIRSIF